MTPAIATTRGWGLLLSTTENGRTSIFIARSLNEQSGELTHRFKYHNDWVTNRMKVLRLIWQSYSIIVGVTTDEFNLEQYGGVRHKHR